MKRGAPDHPKTFALAESLGVRRVYAVGLLEMLFHFTSQYAPQGDIGRYSDKRIAAGMDWAGSVPKLIDSLVTTGWLDRHSVARLVVHDWSDHADRTTLQRLARQGKKAIQLNQSDTGDVCPQSETCIHPCLSLSLSQSQSLSHYSHPPNENTDNATGECAERMYALHPKKRNLVLVLPSLEKAVASGVLASDIEACHAEWCRTEEWRENNGKFVPKLDEWISDKGYTVHPDGNKPEKHVPTAKELIAKGII